MSDLRSPGQELRSPALGTLGLRRVEGGSGGAKKLTSIGGPISVMTVGGSTVGGLE